ncbi:aa3-type cytochrome c oxidase subunit IV [Novosphingobium sp. FSY-8]|uniref:Aa3-type cytochrome c oxidase subunit IV n=1 Tax=Novosphingobium ovatum TaxID=1908523 RepID=A0ABW9XB03_9SPHN|nr:aa3-type cytochrome c oxidase subunit IV [Novosphingobium ovatum]
MANGHDMKAAEATYAGFISLIKYSTPVVAVIAALVVFLITR